jgi:hypothetical protein
MDPRTRLHNSSSFLLSARKAIEFFAAEIPELVVHCLKLTQRSRKTTLEKLVGGNKKGLRQHA